MSSPRPGDMSAGFVGLAVAMMFLLGTVLTIVELTNQKFAAHTPAAAPAQPAPHATH
jgi:hypothetical protein